MASLIRFRYDPFTGFDGLFNDALYARCLPSRSLEVGGACTDTTQRLDSFRPRMDVKESENSNDVTATFELPGIKREDVTVDLQQNRLTVSGESTTTDALEGEGYAVRERRSGKFSRTLQIPLGTKAEDVKAKMENGILTVTFPKSIPEQEPHRITIQ